MAKKKIFTSEDRIKILTLHEDGYSTLQLSNIYNVSQRFMTEYLKSQGIQISRYKYSINHDFFKKIDTEWKAYWLGFITADGNVRWVTGGRKHRYILKIKLAIIDRDHLQKFLDVAESNHPIHIRLEDGRETATIEISSPQMVSDLISYGVVPAKSMIVKPYYNISANLLRHYIRGLIDGDGYISLIKNSEGEYLRPRIQLSGTYHMCKFFQDFSLRHSKSTATVRPEEKIFNYVVNGRYSVPIIRELYLNCTVYLDRKYEMAMRILNGFDNNAIQKNYSKP